MGSLRSVFVLVVVMVFLLSQMPKVGTQAVPTYLEVSCSRLIYFRRGLPSIDRRKRGSDVLELDYVFYVDRKLCYAEEATFRAPGR
jgi:hypothetical protein